MKILYSTLIKIDDTLMGLMFFAWMIVVPSYLFLSSYPDVYQRMLHVIFVGILYISFSSSKLFTSNPKLESILKIILILSQVFFFVTNINLIEQLAPKTIFAWGYLFLLGIALSQALLQSIMSIIQLIVENDLESTVAHKKTLF